MCGSTLKYQQDYDTERLRFEHQINTLTVTLRQRK
ncbi:MULTISPECIES: hypothetical protein [Enterobacter]